MEREPDFPLHRERVAEGRVRVGAPPALLGHSIVLGHDARLWSANSRLHAVRSRDLTLYHPRFGKISPAFPPDFGILAVRARNQPEPRPTPCPARGNRCPTGTALERHVDAVARPVRRSGCDDSFGVRVVRGIDFPGFAGFRRPGETAVTIVGAPSLVVVHRPPAGSRRTRMTLHPRGLNPEGPHPRHHGRRVTRV